MVVPPSTGTSSAACDGEERWCAPRAPAVLANFTPAATAGGWSAAHRQEQEPIIGTPPTTTSILLRHNRIDPGFGDFATVAGVGACATSASSGSIVTATTIPS